MITMFDFGNEKKAGRLGNQLFQYASLYGIAKLSGQELSLPTWKYANYFEYDFSTPDIPLFKGMNKNILVDFHEQKFEYHADYFLNGLADNRNINIDNNFKGYFQSYKYWQHCEKEVREMLTFKAEFKNKLRAGLPTNIFDKPTIAVCIRRGDYVDNPHYYQLPISYYINCLLSFGNLSDYNILFFSDDIEYCKRHFECITGAYFSEGRTDIEDLCIISMCSNHILGNSTFHWWGAYLANNKPRFSPEENGFIGQVFYPDRYFDGDLAKRASTVDFWPWYWTKQIADRNPPSASFITVYKRDSDDREKNYTLLLDFLKKDFRGLTHVAMNNDASMHRTKAINELVKISKFKVIVSIDVDVIVPPMQLAMAIEMILNDEADVVYPYGGNFIKLNRASWYARLAKSLDIGILPKFPDTRMSVGGCVVFNRKKFIEAGMENENFISYGPEDKERFCRFMKLGLRVDRVQGNLYHMNHSIGKDSSAANPHYKKNCDEYQKVKNMSKEELQEYIKTWAWTK